MAARESYVSGRRGIAELTGAVQGAVSPWEGGLSLADVTPAEPLTIACMAVAGRSLALAKQAGVDPDEALKLVDWNKN